MAAPTIDHRGPAFQALALEVLQQLGRVFGTTAPVAVYPASGTGDWEAAMVNRLAPATPYWLSTQVISPCCGGRWRASSDLSSTWFPATGVTGRTPGVVAEKLAADIAGAVKAVCVVHNETSTG
jgi:alanine-glyoxylate transaminase / serine-glyoxylate transaminase / serine-pyruvate transaminase